MPTTSGQYCIGVRPGMRINTSNIRILVCTPYHFNHVSFSRNDFWPSLQLEYLCQITSRQSCNGPQLPAGQTSHQALDMDKAGADCQLQHWTIRTKGTLSVWPRGCRVTIHNSSHHLACQLVTDKPPPVLQGGASIVFVKLLQQDWHRIVGLWGLGTRHRRAA